MKLKYDELVSSFAFKFNLRRYSVGEGEEYVYIDNVAVDSNARRRQCGSAMLEASSDAAMAWGAGVIYTHVHAENVVRPGVTSLTPHDAGVRAGSLDPPPPPCAWAFSLSRCYRTRVSHC